MKRIVLIYGCIAGAITAGMFVITWPLHEQGIVNMDNGMLIGYTTMVIAFSTIFFAVKSYRDRHLSGIITFGKAFKVGLFITLIAAVIYALAWEVMYNTLASNFCELITEQTLQKMEKEGATAEAIAANRKEMEDFTVMYQNPLIRFPMTLMEIIPVGLLISLISAALLRRKQYAN